MTELRLILYRGYFSGGGGGGKFSWMVGFVVIRGNKIVFRLGLNHTPHACVELWPLI